MWVPGREQPGPASWEVTEGDVVPETELKVQGGRHQPAVDLTEAMAKAAAGGATFSAVLWGPGQQEGGWDWRGIRKNFLLLLLLLALLSEKGATHRPRALPF